MRGIALSYSCTNWSLVPVVQRGSALKKVASASPLKQCRQQPRLSLATQLEWSDILPHSISYNHQLQKD